MFLVSKKSGNYSNIVLAIGNFDGVHIGHIRLLQETVKIAKKLNTTSAALIFYPHPKQITKKQDIYIQNIRTRIKRIQNIGIQNIYIMRTTKKMLEMTPDSFIEEVLVKKIKPSYIVVGENFNFGHKKSGDAHYLKEKTMKYNITTNIFLLHENAENHQTYSSTDIREKIKQGKIEEVQKIMNEEYTMSGKVIYGKQIGRTIGFPTANIDITSIVKPPYGVYFTEINIGDGIYRKSIANIGYRPTISDQKQCLLEVHILNFDQDIYHKYCIVKIKSFIRKEKKFNNLEDLKEQIKQDILYLNNILAN